MNDYILTQEDAAELRALIMQVEQDLSGALEESYTSAAEQDGHHDEGHQLGKRNAAVLSERLDELRSILQCSRVVKAPEQSTEVLIGNGVRILYEDGSTFSFVLRGYVSSARTGNRVSILSPLGRALIGKKRGQGVCFQAPQGSTSATIQDILPPSRASEIFDAPPRAT